MEVTKYRLVELTEDALDRWEHGKYLSCCILGRSIFETVLNLEWINYQIQDFLDGKLSPEEIHKKLMLATHASRMEDSPLTSVNIMSIIQMIDKRMSNVAGHGITTNARVYGWFSGFAHPNADGAFLLYAKINKNSLTIDLSGTMHPIPPTVAIDFIRLSLSLFELAYSNYALLFPAFVQKSDELYDHDEG
ncbi:MAG: hypothetical protein JSS75_01970 [Bacteroidetes bacterium]|nr:hypothetical protein [Bacteroidota bacterium]